MSADQIRKKYLPNLTEHLACCTSIYQRLVQLLPPTYVTGEVFSWDIAQYAKLEVLIEEQHKYTDYIIIRYIWNTESKWLTDLEIKLNLCHDMNLAEVNSFHSHGHAIDLLNRTANKGQASYPDEKRQVHHLLLEWLSLSLTS